MGDPAPVYYPSCVVNLRLRFDESLRINMKTAKQLFAFSPEELLKAPQSPDAPSELPLFMQNGNEDNLSFVNGRVPKSANVELPAYRDAGKFSLTFDYRDLPIDPRVIRSCGVEIYMDTVAPGDFSTGIKEPPLPGGERVSAVERRARTSMLEQSKNNLVMIGTVDSWQVTHSANGSEISMEGRDLRAVLIDSPLDPAIPQNLDLKQNIVQVVRTIVQKHPFGGKMNVDGPNPDDWPNYRIPSPADVGGLTRVRRGADGKKATASTGAEASKMSYWDLITKYCTLVGAVPYYFGQTLVVAPARSLYAQLAAGTLDRADLPWVQPPFIGGPRNVGEAEPIRVRRLVHGRNIEELNFERKFNGFVPRTIHLVSLDTSSNQRGAGRLLEVYHPKRKGQGNPNATAGGPTTFAQNQDHAAVSQVAPGGSNGSKNELRISVPGITDKKRLQQMAEDFYEELSRGEQGGSVKTRDLASFGAGNEDPDLLRLRPGDVMELSVDTTNLSSGFPVRSPLNDQTVAGSQQLARELTQRLGDVNLAAAIVGTTRNYIAGLQNYFRVSNVKFEWNIKSGIAVAFDFQNYLEARNAVTPLNAPSGKKAYKTNTGQSVPRRT